MIKPNKFTINSTQVIPVGLEILQWPKILFQMIHNMKTKDFDNPAEFAPVFEKRKDSSATKYLSFARACYCWGVCVCECVCGCVGVCVFVCLRVQNISFTQCYISVRATKTNENV